MTASFESNPLLDKLPAHLKQFIVPQHYKDYSAINQATWRYVMRKNVSYLSKVAHHSYLEGLQKTGIDIESIPSMYGMNRILKEIGWAAVAVDGFIPPSEFMEFLAYNVLIIACDIRQLDHIEYTPAPDIIHEGAGHAPIIANPEYAEYLRRIGELGSKAICSSKDHALYEAIRLLSILKEAPGTAKQDIDEAEKQVEFLQDNMGKPSEMAEIRNLLWWTVEYGLIGSIDDPKIYGAGLLSSIGESEWCMKKEVIKLPYTIDSLKQSFDITKPQPQLFVTPNFAHLSTVLEEYANTMAIRAGGITAVHKLIDSHALGTIELSTGIQISGIFSKVIEHDGKPIYIQTKAKTALAYRNKELVGHSTQIHDNGFGFPVGKLKGINIAIEDMSPRDLKAYDIYEGEMVNLIFEGNITVNGKIITGTRNIQGKIMIIKLTDCTVRFHNEVLFSPQEGIYDMVIGKEVISGFNGPADFDSFDMVTHVASTKTIKQDFTPKHQHLDNLYKQVREHREGKLKANLPNILNEVKLQHPSDWLLTLEIAEIAVAEKESSGIYEEAISHLTKLKNSRKEISHLIENGMGILEFAF